MQISAHDYHNKFNSVGNSSVTSATPAWSHAFTAQNNVTAAIVAKTGGTYSLKHPEVEEVTDETQPKVKKAAKK